MRRVFIMFFSILAFFVVILTGTVRIDAEPVVKAPDPIANADPILPDMEIQDPEIVDNHSDILKNINKNMEQSPKEDETEKALPIEDAFRKDGEKTAFLTFDDGPTKNITPQILDILKKYNIKATFFVIGKLAEKNSLILKRIYDEGHAIGNHTYSHDYKYIYDNIENFTKDVDKCRDTLKKMLGSAFTTRLFRFPGGSTETNNKAFFDTLEDKGYKYIDWNALNGDAEGMNIPAENLLKRLKQTVGSKDHIVVLMHDAASKKTTIEALPGIIEFLKSQGFSFKILS